MIDWDKEYKKLNRLNKCPTCKKQKKTVILGLDWSAAPKSLPVAMTDKGCKNERCKDFTACEVW